MGGGGVAGVCVCLQSCSLLVSAYSLVPCLKVSLSGLFAWL